MPSEVKGKSAKTQDKKELIGKPAYMLNDSINKDVSLIGGALTSEQLADKVIQGFISQEYIKSAKIVVEEARKYLSKKSVDNLMDLDNKLQEFEILLADLLEVPNLKDYKKQISKLNELRIFSKGLEVKGVKDYLDQVLVAIGDYATEAKLCNSDNAIKKLQAGLELSFEEVLK